MLVRCTRCGVEVEVDENEVRADRRVRKLTRRRQWSCYCSCGEVLVRDVELDGRRVRIVPAAEGVPAVTYAQLVAQSLTPTPQVSAGAPSATPERPA